MFHKLIGALGLAALLAVSSNAGAQVWTAVGSTGAVEDTSLANYFAGGSSLAFRSGATGTVAAGYNVTNPLTSGSPAWTTLELTARNAGGSPATFANATLYRVPRTGSSASGLCTLAAPATGATSTTTCTFSSTLVDFANYNYFVRVILGRDSTASTQAAFGIRVY